MIIIAKNITLHDIELDDLNGVVIPSLSYKNISELFNIIRISSSKNLIDNINNGNMIINDGNSDLSISNSLKHIKLCTEYEINSKNSVFGNKKIDFTFHNENGQGHECKGTSYQYISSFIYEGTNIWTPSYIKIIGSKKSSSGTCYFKLVDHSNNDNLICSISWTLEDQTIYTISELNNLPSLESILEIQMKTSHSNITGRIHYFCLQ
jgi:hypothetical protein